MKIFTDWFRDIKNNTNHNIISNANSIKSFIKFHRIIFEQKLYKKYSVRII